jgi:hypothetical protein
MCVGMCVQVCVYRYVCIGLCVYVCIGVKRSTCRSVGDARDAFAFSSCREGHRRSRELFCSSTPTPTLPTLCARGRRGLRAEVEVEERYEGCLSVRQLKQSLRGVESSSRAERTTRWVVDMAC